MFLLNPIFVVLALKLTSENLQNIVAEQAIHFSLPAQLHDIDVRKAIADIRKIQLLLHNSIRLFMYVNMYTAAGQTVFGLLHRLLFSDPTSLAYIIVATIYVSGLLQLFGKMHCGAYQLQLVHIRAIVKHRV
jgi:hypothetical protein